MPFEASASITPSNQKEGYFVASCYFAYKDIYLTGVHFIALPYSYDLTKNVTNVGNELFAFAAILKLGETVPVSNNALTCPKPFVLIIDPGHGGEDGGAIGIDGTVESKINLEISQKANEIAKLLGLRVHMTRSEDISIHDPSANTLRQKKISDLKNRVSLCNEIEN